MPLQLRTDWPNEAARLPFCAYVLSDYCQVLPD